jgi:small-conductance mechanosensitive channel
VAQIPLSTFAVLGGALAIGFGFGSQNIIKNFISGLILMIEQPIRVGDIITAEGGEGKIIRIGARSTHIRTFDSVDILVPNSTLLENNVVNWTLSDTDIRTKVRVGVAYGSSTRKVEQLLVKATEESPEVLRQRPIMVFFRDFGDNSLVFDVQFWCRMSRPSDRWRVESCVRHHITEIFEKEGVVIAFPQRDIHFDQTPIQVELRTAPAKKTKASTNKAKA